MASFEKVSLDLGVKLFNELEEPIEGATLYNVALGVLSATLQGEGGDAKERKAGLLLKLNSARRTGAPFEITASDRDFMRACAVPVLQTIDFAQFGDWLHGRQRFGAAGPAAPPSAETGLESSAGA